MSTTASESATPHRPSRSPPWTRRTFAGVLILLAIHSLLLARLGVLYSPTRDEPAHLAAGFRIWSSGRFDLYPVNPPLVKMIATWPLIFFQPQLDTSRISVVPGERPEFLIGRTFLASNQDWPNLIILARWSCIPLNLLGAVVAFQWAREVFGAVSGWTALCLWCLDPNILGNGCLITPDVGASSLGLVAGFLFWRWLNEPGWGRVILAGLGLGLAWLSKSTLLILAPVWGLCWILDRGIVGPRSSRKIVEFFQLLALAVTATYVLNFGYGFAGSCRRLGDYEFVSQTLGGPKPNGQVSSNRFQGSWMENIPVPLPADLLRGLDLQRRDFELKRWSYLGGEWRYGGWPLFYLWGILWKSPCGYLLLGAWALGAGWWKRTDHRRAMTLIGVSALAIIGIVSIEQGFTIHLRYVLPALPFAIVLMSGVGHGMTRQAGRKIGLLAVTLTTIGVSSLHCYPYPLSYFNELSGGPMDGYRRLLDANLDWGQDLYFVREWVEQHPEAQPLTLSWDPLFDPELVGLNLRPTPCWLPKASSPTPESLKGWHILEMNELYSVDNRWAPFRDLTPIDRIGYSVMVYRIDAETASKLSSYSAPH